MLTQTSAQKDITASPERRLSAAGAAILAVALSACFLLLQQTLVGSHWETNDDVAYTLVASGCAIAPNPDEHLLTPNAFVGLALKALYTAMPSTPWYFLFLIGAQFLATAAIGYTFFRKHNSLIAGGLMTAFFLAAGLYLSTSLQFTSTALLTGMAGGLLLLLHVEQPENKRERNFLFAASIALFVACSLTRVSCAYLAGLLTAAAIECKSFPKFDTTARSAIACLGTTLAICFGLQMLGKQYSDQDNKWKDFNSSRPALTKIIDFAGLSQSSTQKVLDDTKWSENDLAMLRNFLYCDAKVFPSEKIILAAGGVPTVRQDISIPYLQTQIGQISSDKLLYPLAAMALIAAWFLPKTGMSRLRFSVLVAMTAGCALYMLCCLKLPARVYFPLTSFVLLTSFFYVCDRQLLGLWQTVKTNRGVAVVCGVLLSAIVALSVWVDYRWLWKPVKTIAAQSAQLKGYLSALPTDKTYVVFAYGFPYELLPPSQDPKAFFGNVRLLTVGGYNNSPIFEAQKKQLGITDVCKDLLKPNVVLISNDYLNQFYAKYMAEHHGVPVRIQPIADYKPLPLQMFKVTDETANVF